MSTQLAEGPAAQSTRSPHLADSSLRPALTPVLTLVALTVIGFALRLVVARQSLFADELSTYWISATHSLGGVLSLVYGTGRIKHAEITPPLYFLAAWLTSQLGHAAIWLRMPSLIAGTLTIPLVYMVGLRSVGRRAALLAAAVTALAPFMIYYSGEARAYAVLMALTLGSTLAMLLAIDGGRTRWWVLYAVSSCAAFYTHYTCAFVLGAQFLWLLWAHPEARKPAVIANIAAAAAVIPWIPGMIQDFTSPTLKILSALSPFTPHDIALDLGHWTVGYPYVEAGGLRALPGLPALILLALATALTVVGLLARRLRAGSQKAISPVSRRVALMVLLALAVPVGEAVVSLSGNHIFGVRNLAASWPYLTLSCAAVVAASDRRIALVASGLAVIAFALASTKMLGERFDRPRYQAAADYVASHARPGDVVIDTTGSLSPGPLTGFDVAHHTRLRIVRAQSPAERDHPYGFLDPIVSLPQAIRTAVRAAAGHRVFLVEATFTTNITPLQSRLAAATARFPAPYRLVAQQRYPSIGLTSVKVYAPAGSSGQ